MVWDFIPIGTLVLQTQKQPVVNGETILPGLTRRDREGTIYHYLGDGSGKIHKAGNWVLESALDPVRIRSNDRTDPLLVNFAKDYSGKIDDSRAMASDVRCKMDRAELKMMVVYEIWEKRNAILFLGRFMLF